jgi:hypothetical protein
MMSLDAPAGDTSVSNHQSDVSLELSGGSTQGNDEFRRSLHTKENTGLLTGVEKEEELTWPEVARSVDFLGRLVLPVMFGLVLICLYEVVLQ